MTPTERILAALTDRNCDPKRNGNGWSACCPAHEDRRPSLSITEGVDRRALVRCHVGCSADAVCGALGLRVADLMPDSPSTTSTELPNGRGKQQNGRQCSTKPAKVYPTAKAAIEALEGRHGKRSAHWTYLDAEGEPVGVVVRWNLPDGKKDIRPVAKQEDTWRIGGMPDPRPLYCLPDLADAKQVFIVEGEKAADAARAIGLVATTSAHGSQSADKADWTPLAGKECVILPDQDQPGEKYANATATILAKLEPAAVVKVARLPNLPEHGDIADWIDAQADVDVAELRREVEALAVDAEDIRAEAIEADQPKSDSQGISRPALVCMADIEPRPISWIWPGRIAAGRITLAVGMPGAGKSFLTCDLASRVSTGTPWPDGPECQRGSVVFITAEDDPHDTIRPRLDAHYADVSRIHLLSGVRRTQKGKTEELAFTLTDADILRQTLEAIDDCRLVVIDPIGSFLGGRCDAHRDNEVRAVLAPIAKLAEQHGAAVLMVAHRRKSASAIADDTALGSRAFTGIARSVWHLSRDTENRDRRLLLPGKCNLASQQTGLAFTIAGDPAGVHWERDPVIMTADDALARENGATGEHSAFDEATDWLRNTLTDGPRPSAKLKSDAKRDGIAWRTVERAKRKLGVSNRPDGFGGPWVWALPDVAESAGLRQESPDSAKDKNLADTDETVADSDIESPGNDWGEL
ncbi:AAA family ATPase [Pirellulales bacterium]|nr:AAA family ATPase [Pirellulales bacterium]